MRIAPLLISTLAFAPFGVQAAEIQSGLTSKKVLSFDIANEMAQEAIRICRQYDQKATVVVVDDGDHLKALLHDDGADIATIDVARMKATTVILFNGSPSGSNSVGGADNDGCNADTAPMVARGESPPPPAAPPAAPPGGGAGGAPAGTPGAGAFSAGPRFGIPGTLALAGGHPIKVGDQVIGAIAVSGVTRAGKRVPQGDSGCVCAAIAKVKSRLK